MSKYKIKFNFRLYLFLGISLLISLSAYSQEKQRMGFELRQYIAEVNPNTLVPLLAEADPEKFGSYQHQYQIDLHLSIGDLFSFDIPASQVSSFAAEDGIRQIEFSLQPGLALSDTMLVQTNMDSVIRISSPLNLQLDGTGVLLGIIDSGIEINHPDFQDSSGNTRIRYIWDQGVAYNPSRKPGNYNYGVEWTAADIDAGICTHDDKANEFGHGSMVTGAAASNAFGSGQYRGVAPNADIIAVATNFSRPNWLQSVAESVDYIFKKADSLGMPCVINASIGTYRGSHDGLDISARMIDQLIKQKTGRSFVCAAGNAGNLKFHLQHAPQNDTVFTWFEKHPALFAGIGGVYFEIWSDTADFNGLQFAIGADREANQQFEFRGRSPFISIAGKLNQVNRDTVHGLSGHDLAYVDYYAEQSQGRYKIEVALIAPDSGQYLFRLETTGIGRLDLWASYSLQRSAEIRTQNLPSSATYPPMVKYKLPDSLQTIVSSFTCLPSVITVGNYVNRNTYLDVNGVLQNMNATPGKMSAFSSLGPTRQLVQKPDLSSAGDYMMASGRIATMNQLIQIEPSKISQDSLHMRNGGTSMASPTVAGMVALRLQQCSKSSYSAIKNDLIQSSRNDAFTPLSGSLKWGAGKADAFQFLSRSAFQALINPVSGPYCGSDSVPLSLTGNYAHYYWSTGDTSASIVVQQSGNYSVLVENTSGCLSQSDTLNIQFNSLPLAPSIQRSNDTLRINQLGSYQWFLNQNSIPGANQSSIKAIQNGFYHCLYTDTSTNCSISSDTLQIIINSIDKQQLLISSIFPNPSNGKLELNLSETSGEIQLLVYDLKGRLVLQKKLLGIKQRFFLNLSPINRGSYLIQIRSGEQVSQQLIHIL